MLIIVCVINNFCTYGSDQGDCRFFIDHENFKTEQTLCKYIKATSAISSHYFSRPNDPGAPIDVAQKNLKKLPIEKEQEWYATNEQLLQKCTKELFPLVENFNLHEASAMENELFTLCCFFYRKKEDKELERWYTKAQNNTSKLLFCLIEWRRNKV